MNSILDNRILLSQSFESFEELAAMARAWDADFRQVGRSEMEHQVLQVKIDGLLMSRGRFGCHLDQHGETPKGLRTFALLEEDCSPVYWFGHRVGPDVLLVFPNSGEVEAISRPGFCNHTVSIATDDLAEFFERYHGPDLDEVLGPGENIIPLSQVLRHRLREHLRRISFKHSTLLRSLALYDAYRDKLFGLLLEIFSGKSNHSPSHGHQFRRRLIANVVTLIQSHRDERLTLEDLCKVGKVAERTLNEIFKRELGVSPAAFVKGYRLFGAHRDLWRAHHSQARVSDIANSWGFWHLGQFAADYRIFFGELPKSTLKRLTLTGLGNGTAEERNSKVNQCRAEEPG